MRDPNGSGGQKPRLGPPRLRWAHFFLSAVVAGLAVLITVQQAYSHAMGAEAERARHLAEALTQKLEHAAKDAAAGFQEIRAQTYSKPCSASHLLVLRQADMATSLVETFGYRANGRIVCSSIGTDSNSQSELERPNYNSRGIDVWTELPLDFAPKTRFLIIASKNHVAVVNTDLILGAISERDIGDKFIINPVNMQIIVGKRPRDQALLSLIKANMGSAFVFQGNMVGVVRSKFIDAAGVAVVSADQVSARVSRSVQFAAPIGFLVGLTIAGLLYRVLGQGASPEMELRKAIKSSQLALHYQPIVELETGHWVGAEALLRWKRPDGSSTPPDVFIGLAQSAGMMDELTSEVMRLLSNDIPVLIEGAPQDFYVSFNVAASDMKNPLMVSNLVSLAHNANIANDRLTVEITEHGHMDLDVTGVIIKDLRANGFKLAIDDFGAGYSGLAYINKLAIDIIKIDGSFVAALDGEEASMHLIKHMMELACNLQVDVIAEGIETEQHVSRLMAAGVIFGQGWQYAKAMPVQDFRQSAVFRPRTLEPLDA